ncbi:MAG: hypothetical protein HYY66_00415 [Candidatus Tectomicrobia bacterium]|nr:hypothetical protein [Candidatus Tectomicrobia bacterium]
MLSQALVRQGEFLFRWRGYLPLMLAPLVIYGLKDFQYYRDSHLYDILLEVACFAVAFTGLTIRFLVMGYAPAGTMGRNPEQARVLKTEGMYSLCRNPLYLGNFFIGLGVFLFLESALISLVYVLSFWLYYERIILGEETFLLRKFGEEYARWAERTPLIIPRLSDLLRHHRAHDAFRDRGGLCGHRRVGVRRDVAGHLRIWACRLFGGPLPEAPHLPPSRG